MMIRIFPRTLFSLLGLAPALAPAAEKPAGSRPNIVFMLADDMGWNQPGFNGGKKELTPNIDKLAGESLKLTQYYAHSVCAPTRAAFLTGRYACYDTYRARDGRWLAVAAIEPAFWANLCKALGLEEWTPQQHADEHQDEIRAAFREAFARRDRDDWVAELAPSNTCVSPVYGVDERLTTEAAEEMLREAGVDSRRRRLLRDSVAACVILRDFIGGEVRTEKLG